MHFHTSHFIFQYANTEIYNGIYTIHNSIKYMIYSEINLNYTLKTRKQWKKKLKKA